MTVVNVNQVSESRTPRGSDSRIGRIIYTAQYSTVRIIRLVGGGYFIDMNRYIYNVIIQ
jgi:hypothetical protein